jgi:hypothetical protein
MSEPLSDVRALIDLLSPIHDAMERGLSPRTIERVYRCFVAVEDYIDELEDQLVHAEGALEAAETEQDQPSSGKPPL